KPELITKPEMDDRIYQNGPEEFLECGSYIVVPMLNGDAVIGLIALSRSHSSPKFTEAEFETVKTLAGFAAEAVQNSITVKEVIEHNGVTKETDLAINIQSMLRPVKLPIIKDVQIGSLFEQNEGVCGDFYDVIPSRKDRVSFIVGDIAGKGINSVMIMTMVRAMLRLVVNTKQTAGTILNWVNKGISGESFSADHFGSLALVNYDPETSKIEFSSCGTTPLYWYSGETNSIEKISVQSEPIGVEKSTEYKNYMHDVKKGDIMIMYTDGIVESLNDAGKQYTTDRLLKLIQTNHNSSGKDIVNLVKADIKKFSGSLVQHDDQTLLIVKF
ncbi:MAG: SpoIIE family protein phosphatase, partial [Treponema sp.]|nr:SpoIIE family protein phosphatase [Treponema sp.]